MKLNFRAKHSWHSTPNNYLTWHTCLICHIEVVPPCQTTPYIRTDDCVPTLQPGAGICTDCQIRSKPQYWHNDASFVTDNLTVTVSDDNIWF